MGFQWDADSTRSVSLAEERFASLGLDGLGRVLVVNWTWRGKEIRLISARRATPQELRQYQEGQTNA